MEDLGDNEIVLKVAKPRSQKQIETFEKARAIRLENSILKKEGIEKVKADVKNRNKSTLPKVSTTQSGLMEQIEPKPKESVAKPFQGQSQDLRPELKESVAKPLPSEVLSEEEPEVIIVKKKKKPKVIYVEGSSDEEPEPIRVKKEKVNIPKEPEPIVKEPLVIKPSIRFC